MARQHYLLIGKIVGTHGLKGAVKIQSYAESGHFFRAGGKIYTGSTDGTLSERKILWAKSHGKNWLLSFNDVVDEAAALELFGRALYIRKAALPELDEGTYYWDDLIGMKVYTESAEYLGCIDSIFPTGSNDVYVVKRRGDGGEKETLIPALASVVRAVDIRNGVMQVTLPEGL